MKFSLAKRISSKISEKVKKDKGSSGVDLLSIAKTLADRKLKEEK